MGRLIEGLWDCKYCDLKGIGGSKRECPSCGKVRDVNTKFYMPSEKTMYVPEDEAKKINRNPDWVCPYCDTLNSDSFSVCQQCGSERTSENLDYFENREKRDSKKEEVTDTTKNEDVIVDPDEDTFSSSTDNSEQKTKSTFQNCIESCVDLFKNYAEYLIGAIAIIAIIVGLVWIFSPKTQEITVDAIHWERSIEIERYQTVNENGWTLPQGARLHETRNEIYTYQQVLDHYENKTREVAKQRISGYEEKVVGHRDLGNGYFEEITERVPVYETYYETEHYQEPVYRSEPVYKTKYYYEIDKWLYDRTLTSAGFDKSPYWDDTSGLGTDEREGKREENYYIRGTNSKGKSKEISISYSEWSDLNVGDKVKVKVSVFGNGELIQIIQ